MTMSSYRPAAPPATILDEVIGSDPRRRCRACEAVCATVWGAGLNACASVAERRSWQLSYAEYLSRLAVAHAHETSPPAVAKGLVARPLPTGQ